MEWMDTPRGLGGVGGHFAGLWLLRLTMEGAERLGVRGLRVRGLRPAQAPVLGWVRSS